MTTQEVLEEAIQKAIDGGWKPKWVDEDSLDESMGYFECMQSKLFGEFSAYDANPSVYDVIFNHDFAKALWPGDSLMMRWLADDIQAETEATPVPAWEYHLQKMVIADDPIKYLGENI